MRIDLSDDAIEFAAVVRAAIGSAGGDTLAQMAEAGPGAAAAVDTALTPLGLWDLNVRADADQAEAAAAACRSVGWWAAPGSVAARLARPGDLDADALCVVARARPRAAIDGSQLRWVAVDLDGVRSDVTARVGDTALRTSGGVVDIALATVDTDGADDVGWGLLLEAWTLLGAMDRAMALTVDYVKERHQFGKPLAAFQAVQFQLTEAEVERAGVEMLARYALWSVCGGRPEALHDVLALRVAALDAADEVFRICHQLHGAIGFCDEATISWISRYSQPLRRLPLPASGTRAELVRRAGRAGLTGLYA